MQDSDQFTGYNVQMSQFNQSKNLNQQEQQIRDGLSQISQYNAENGIFQIEQALDNLQRSNHANLHTIFSNVIKDLNNIAVVQLNQNNYDTCMLILEKCDQLTIANKYGVYQSLRALTYNNLACYYRRRGQLQQGLACLDKALRLLNIAKSNEYLGLTHLNMCAILSQMGMHEESLEYSRRAVMELYNDFNNYQEEISKNVSKNQNSVEEKKILMEKATSLAISFHNVGVEEEHFKNTDQAIQNYQNSYIVANDNLGSNHRLTLKFKQIYDNFMLKSNAHGKKLVRPSSAATSKKKLNKKIQGKYYPYMQNNTQMCHLFTNSPMSKTNNFKCNNIMKSTSQQFKTTSKLRPASANPKFDNKNNLYFEYKPLVQKEQNLNLSWDSGDDEVTNKQIEKNQIKFIENVSNYQSVTDSRKQKSNQIYQKCETQDQEYIQQKLHRQIQDMNQEKQNLEQQLYSAELKLSDLNMQKQQEQQEIERIHQQTQQKNQDIEMLKQIESQIQKQKEDALYEQNTFINQKQEQIRSMSEEEKRIKKEIDHIKMEKGQVQESLLQEQKIIQEQIKIIKDEKVQQELQQKRKLETLENQIISKKQEQFELQQQVEEQEKQNQERIQLLRDQESKNQQLQNELQELRQKKQQEEDQLNNIKQSLENSIQELKQQEILYQQKQEQQRQYILFLELIETSNNKIEQNNDQYLLRHYKESNISGQRSLYGIYYDKIQSDLIFDVKVFQDNENPKQSSIPIKLESFDQIFADNNNTYLNIHQEHLVNQIVEIVDRSLEIDPVLNKLNIGNENSLFRYQHQIEKDNVKYSFNVEKDFQQYVLQRNQSEQQEYNAQPQNFNQTNQSTEEYEKVLQEKQQLEQENKTIQEDKQQIENEKNDMENTFKQKQNILQNDVDMYKQQLYEIEQDKQQKQEDYENELKRKEEEIERLRAEYEERIQNQNQMVKEQQQYEQEYDCSANLSNIYENASSVLIEWNQDCRDQQNEIRNIQCIYNKSNQTLVVKNQENYKNVIIEEENVKQNFKDNYLVSLQNNDVQVFKKIQFNPFPRDQITSYVGCNKLKLISNQNQEEPISNNFISTLDQDEFIKQDEEDEYSEVINFTKKQTADITSEGLQINEEIANIDTINTKNEVQVSYNKQHHKLIYKLNSQGLHTEFRHQILDNIVEDRNIIVQYVTQKQKVIQEEELLICEEITNFFAQEYNNVFIQVFFDSKSKQIIILSDQYPIVKYSPKKLTLSDNKYDRYDQFQEEFYVYIHDQQIKIAEKEYTQHFDELNIDLNLFLLTENNQIRLIDPQSNYIELQHQFPQSQNLDELKELFNKQLIAQEKNESNLILVNKKELLATRKIQNCWNKSYTRRIPVEVANKQGEFKGYVLLGKKKNGNNIDTITLTTTQATNHKNYMNLGNLSYSGLIRNNGEELKKCLFYDEEKEIYIGDWKIDWLRTKLPGNQGDQQQKPNDELQNILNNEPENKILVEKYRIQNYNVQVMQNNNDLFVDTIGDNTVKSLTIENQPNATEEQAHQIVQNCYIVDQNNEKRIIYYNQDMQKNALTIQNHFARPIEFKNLKIKYNTNDNQQLNKQIDIIVKLIRQKKNFKIQLLQGEGYNDLQELNIGVLNKQNKQTLFSNFKLLLFNDNILKYSNENDCVEFNPQYDLQRIHRTQINKDQIQNNENDNKILIKQIELSFVELQDQIVHSKLFKSDDKFIIYLYQDNEQKDEIQISNIPEQKILQMYEQAVLSHIEIKDQNIWNKTVKFTTKCENEFFKEIAMVQL